jgi:DASH complex subunit ASK1
VQTPARGGGKLKAYKDEITWESDSDEDGDGIYAELGMSPPKTMTFAVPQSRLLRTPGMFFQPYWLTWPAADLESDLAREASKKIVEDLLLTAGAGVDDTDGFNDSPSVVGRNVDVDDSF